MVYSLSHQNPVVGYQVTVNSNDGKMPEPTCPSLLKNRQTSPKNIQAEPYNGNLSSI